MLCRYAKEVRGEECRFQANTADYKAFIGFHILMAINYLPSIDDYWKRDLYLHYPPVADRISRDHFRELSRYLHFVDNTTLHPRGNPLHDRLGKVRPIIEHLEKRFAQVYEPNRELSVDEAMIKFQGRSSIKQYMPMKPTKRGIKVWVLADGINGFFPGSMFTLGKRTTALT